MLVQASVDDKDLQGWFNQFEWRLDAYLTIAVGQAITDAERFMLGPQVLGKWPTPHEDVYPPPPGKGEVPGKYWSLPGTVPTRVSEQLVKQVRQTYTTVNRSSGFRTYERGVGSTVWYALKQEHGFYSPRLKHGVSARPFLLPTLEWLDTSGTVDRLFGDAVDRILR